MPGRREFLGLMAAAMGSAVLGGCGGGDGSGSTSTTTTGGSSSSTTVPNAFSVSTMLASGASLPGGLRIGSNSTQPRRDRSGRAVEGSVVQVALTGYSWLTDDGQIVFLAHDNQGGHGMYIGEVDLASQQVANVRKIVRTGDRLPDGSSVVRFTPGDVNGSGQAAFRIERDDGKLGIYLYRDASLHEVVRSYQPLTTRARLSGSLPPHVSLADDGGMLITAPLSNALKLRGLGYGLLGVPDGDRARVSLLLHTGDLLPGTSSVIRLIAGHQLRDGGDFVVAGVATPPGYEPPHQSPAPAGNVDRPTFLVKGTIGGSLSVIAAHASVGGSGASGMSNQAPRLGFDGTTAYVVRQSGGREDLYVDGKSVLTADTDGGDISPLGHPITAILPPAIGNGLVVFLVSTTAGHELLAHGGGKLGTVLAPGDRVGGKVVDNITFGAASRQINRDGQITFRADFTDTTSALLVATPV